MTLDLNRLTASSAIGETDMPSYLANIFLDISQLEEAPRHGQIKSRPRLFVPIEPAGRTLKRPTRHHHEARTGWPSLLHPYHCVRALDPAPTE